MEFRHVIPYGILACGRQMEFGHVIPYGIFACGRQMEFGHVIPYGIFPSGYHMPAICPISRWKLHVLGHVAAIWTRACKFHMEFSVWLPCGSHMGHVLPYRACNSIWQPCASHMELHACPRWVVKSISNYPF